MSDTEVQHDKVRELLDSLGATPLEVASRLRAEGIVGYPKEAGSCPISHYVRKHTDAYSAFVCPDNTLVTIQTDDDSETERYVENPPPVEQFVREFDRGAYRDLIALQAEDE